MPMALRRLPFVLRPLPDEPFGSWFEAIAAAHRATAGEMAQVLGLFTSSRVALATSSWSRLLTPQQVEHLEQATGLAASTFRATTRAGFAAHVVQYHHDGSISRKGPARASSGRYCPDCLRDSGGRWRLSWEFGFSFSCIRHQRLLAERCPKCARPPLRYSLPHNLVPEPALCHNTDTDDAVRKLRRCRGDLGEVLASEAFYPDIASAQRFVLRLVAQGRSAEGIWSTGPQPAMRVLSDIRFLARIAHNTPQAAKGTSGWEVVHALNSGSPLAESRPTASQTVRDVAVGYTVAWQAAQEVDRVRQLLHGRVSEHASYSNLSPQLQSLIAEARGARRRPTAVLQTALKAINPEARAARIPAQLWGEWTGILAPRRDRYVAASALSAAIVFTGSRITHAVALRMLDETVSTRRVSYVMRDLGSPDAEVHTLAMIVKLAEYLDQAVTPIDYRRRRALDYSDLLPESEWEQLASDNNAHTGAPRRPALARAYLHRLLSGDGAHRLPTHHTAQLTDADIDAFARAAPNMVTHALKLIGEAFLRERGIDEPLTWCPDPDSVGAQAEATVQTSVNQTSKWKARRSARGPAGGEKEAAIVAAYGGGATTRSIAATLGVSKQTISRVLHAHGVEPKRGAAIRYPVDFDRLVEQYSSGARTAAELAIEVGCSVATIRRHLQFATRSVHEGKH